MTRTSILPIAALTALLLAPAAHAQTVITGHHDNGNAYIATNGTYLVPADTGTTPSATFNGNEYYGLFAYGSTTTIAGGQYNNNGFDGLAAVNATVTITGGQFLGHSPNGQSTAGVHSEGNNIITISGGIFSNNVSDVSAEGSCRVTVSGGTFTGGIDYAIAAFTGSNISVTGGIFSGNAADFDASGGSTTVPAGVLDIYGSFLNPATGQPLLLGQTYSLTGLGSFTGTLQNNTVAQSYSYDNYNATITLHNTGLVPAPEPSQGVALVIGALGLGALTVRARKRSAHA